MNPPHYSTYNLSVLTIRLFKTSQTSTDQTKTAKLLEPLEGKKSRPCVMLREIDTGRSCARTAHFRVRVGGGMAVLRRFLSAAGMVASVCPNTRSSSSTWRSTSSRSPPAGRRAVVLIRAPSSAGTDALLPGGSLLIANDHENGSRTPTNLLGCTSIGQSKTGVEARRTNSFGAYTNLLSSALVQSATCSFPVVRSTQKA